ncbi:esterase FE4-like [Ostrinia furnacalis]|uniref:esterase FE4-like n=1 Tax=Ostrinia furnacalis TaxID=93504 RepID=UPI0010403BF1|nr:esterase FE4-like [Ostrinia furnacalis]
MVQVKISDGILEGEKVHSDICGDFYSFKGIPYAAPPVGDLRFKAPQPPIPWEGVRPAKKCGSSCYQFNFMTRTRLNGSEDCLYLNVYSPNLTPAKPLPVMFFIHGGAFSCGSGDDDVYGPEFLIQHNVILVTLNYRLEILGFLCLDTEDAPGNQGIKDQVAAMRWVQKNISQFGGDPNNVTIFGQSGGAACVTMHCISPMTKGLFKRAVAQSGCMISWWCQFYRPRDRALALAKTLGCNSEDDKELYEFFKNQPVEKLCEIQVPIMLKEKEHDLYDTQFCIVSEKVFPNVETFFTGDILENLKNNVHEGVELLIGHNEDEGIINIAATHDIKRTLYYANNFKEYFVPRPLAYYCSIDDQLDIGQKIKEYYLNNRTLTTKNLNLLVKYFTAESFKIGIWQMAKYFSVKNKVYMYRFKCKSERNFFVTLCGMSEYFPGGSVVCHIDEIAYLFPVKGINQKINPSSHTFKLIKTVTQLWTNFAKTGNPTPDTSLGISWRQFKANSQNYMDIGNQLVRGTTPDRDEQLFWANIFSKYLPNGIYKNMEL